MLSETSNQQTKENTHTMVISSTLGEYGTNLAQKVLRMALEASGQNLILFDMSEKTSLCQNIVPDTVAM